MAQKKEMTKTQKREKFSSSKIKERLSQTPFKTIKELEAAEHKIALENWKRLATFRNFREQLCEKINEGTKKEFENGILCAIAGDEGYQGRPIVRVYYKPGQGFQTKIDPKALDDPRAIDNLAANLTYAFGSLFYEVYGLKASPLTGLGPLEKQQ